MFCAALTLLFLCLFLALASLLPFSCERCIVRYVRFVHGISVPVVHAGWSLVFRSFWIMFRIDGRGGLNSCLVIIMYLLDVENVVGSGGIQTV